MLTTFKFFTPLFFILSISFFLLELTLRVIHYPTQNCQKLTELGENVIAEFDSTLGWRYLPGQSAAADYGKLYTFSKEGYRSETIDKQTDISKPKTLIVGDSFLFGHGLSFEDTIGYKLSKKLNDEYEVLNYAVQAYGTDQMYLMLQRVFSLYNPDIVIIDYVDDHKVRNVNRDRRDFYPCSRILGTKPIFTIQNDELVLKHKPLLYKDYDNPRVHLALSKLIEPKLEIRAQEKGQKITEKILNEIDEYVTKRNAKLFIVAFSPLLSDHLNKSISTVTINIWGENNKRLYISDTDLHPSAEGTTFVVDKFFESFDQDFFKK